MPADVGPSAPTAPYALPPGLVRGDPFPGFVAPTGGNPRFHLDTIAGRYVVLSFVGTATHPLTRNVLAGFRAARARFDDVNATFMGVVVDQTDVESGRVGDEPPGWRFVHDFDGALSRRFGALPADQAPSMPGAGYRPFTIILDPGQRVLAVVPLAAMGDHAAAVLAHLDAAPAIPESVPGSPPAPVLLVPDVIEPALCQFLVRLYESATPTDSGFMREVNGMTVSVLDYRHKRRWDCMIEDPALRLALRARLERRLLPAIRKAFQFDPTRIERYIVACYDAEVGGHFRPHRDNTTRGTAHRRFAVTVNLNAADYDGGELRFPEFGSHTYRPPTGGALVFSCSLLHEATPVTRGRRYAFLPFLYDEAAEKVREANAPFVQMPAPSIPEQESVQ